MVLNNGQYSLWRGLTLSYCFFPAMSTSGPQSSWLVCQVCERLGVGFIPRIYILCFPLGFHSVVLHRRARLMILRIFHTLEI